MKDGKWPAYLLYRSDAEHWECYTLAQAVATMNDFVQRYQGEITPDQFHIYVRYDKYSKLLRENNRIRKDAVAAVLSAPSILL